MELDHFMGNAVRSTRPLASCGERTASGSSGFLIYTTKALESLHVSLREIIKKPGSFPGEEAVPQLLFLALQDLSARWEGAALEGGAVIAE
jgi:hypothetical protein